MQKSPCLPLIGPVTVLLAALLLLPASLAVAATPDAGQILKPCSACHTTARICANLDRGRDYWAATVQHMMEKGARITPDEIPGFVNTLTLAGATGEARMLLGCTAEDATEPAPVVQPAMGIGVRLLHPALMALNFLLALWVGREGLKRTQFSHFKRKVTFDWKGHVRFGLLVMVLWLLGMAAGSAVTYMVHGSLGVTGTHRSAAMTMFPLILFGIGTGLYMDRIKKPRTLLPLLHGIGNLLLLALALGQLITGLGMVGRMF